MRDGDQFGPKPEALAERSRQGGRDCIVSFTYPERARWNRLLSTGKLIDEREERQFVGIRQEKPAQAIHGQPELRVRMMLVEPPED